jgi:hypothetical protein
MAKRYEIRVYTSREWNKLPILQRLAWCAAGKYNIYPKDMKDAVSRIKELERVLQQISYDRFVEEQHWSSQVARAALKEKKDVD